MTNFFTWDVLGTYAGAVLATTLATELGKHIPLLKALPSRILSYIIAALILIAATIASGALSWGGVFLALINAIVVALAANGTYDAGEELLSVPIYDDTVVWPIKEDK